MHLATADDGDERDFLTGEAETRPQVDVVGSAEFVFLPLDTSPYLGSLAGIAELFRDPARGQRAEGA